MSRLARWCFRHRRRVVVGWLLALVACAGLSFGIGTKFSSDFALPGTDSQAAVNLLKANFPAASGEGDQIVIQATNGASVTSPPVRAAVTAMLGDVARLPDVASVASPYGTGGGEQVSKDGTVAFARVTLDKQPASVTKGEAQKLIDAAKTADGPSVHIALGGASITNANNGGTGPSVLVGFVAALVILLIVFAGALLASLMPLAAAALALIVGISGIGLLSHAFSIPSVATDLSVLIGLGVGVDYGLFIISRHRSAVRAGASYEDAVAQAVNTSGRTVIFAGTTVCIALLGQFVLGVTFLDGLAAGAAVAVALTMATSLTFLPAMLGFLGPKVLSRRERRVMVETGPRDVSVSPLWVRIATLIERRAAVVAAAALAVVVVLALPVLGLRLGSSDASTDPANSTTHQAYEALAKGFGPGFNGPLQLAGLVTGPGDQAAFDNLLATAARTPGVASVSPAVISPNHRAAIATLYPTTSPQASQTVSLVNTLRHEVIPAAESGTTLEVHVGGETAQNIDFSHVLTDKLPLFITVVVLLAFVLLAAVFRSLLIPLVASVMNLLSIGAALGALNAVFNWGRGSSLLGLSATGPIDAFLPVLMFSVLFGLSMDYEVFLVGRIQEEWLGRRNGVRPERASPAEDNHLAVTAGQAKSGRVIAGAAAIMILVFGSFLLGGQRALEEFGFGLAFSVLVDAFVIRSLVVPALMHLIGSANWAIPRVLDRYLPRLSVEVDGDEPAEEDRTPVSVS